MSCPNRGFSRLKFVFIVIKHGREVQVPYGAVRTLPRTGVYAQVLEGARLHGNFPFLAEESE
jgi:hypothetical protein